MKLYHTSNVAVTQPDTAHSRRHLDLYLQGTYTREQALDLFYNSRTFQLISEGVADMHCFSDLYLAEEVEREINHK